MTLTRSHSPPGRAAGQRTRGERAASLVEYCMMIALIAFVCIVAISYFVSTNAGSVSSSANSIVGG